MVNSVFVQVGTCSRSAEASSHPVAASLLSVGTSTGGGGQSQLDAAPARLLRHRCPYRPGAGQSDGGEGIGKRDQHRQRGRQCRLGQRRRVRRDQGRAGITDSWTAEYSGRGVRFNTVAPGPVYTRGAARELFDAIAETTAMKRAAEPAEIAEVVAFLASPKAGHVTGATAADGGRTAIRTRTERVSNRHITAAQVCPACCVVGRSRA
ncbi:SDR family oxidoreductase [Streptomyces sp. JV185]|uniref:SDR family oxidoreductase n=1 Tax=Streptomyces sp. JV185 TaxID=858638 RepID=UPI002E7A3DC8|nr:SDR family oxidoreductase [Streptomyces sp. JV185]MEE1768367.1 SDR family oxidoreductase [Streptomyces sp. JV185]MEE1768384.1 SDR family oxidoreductase [Streptomyces sp. JV185]